IADGFHVYSEKSDCPEYNGPIRASIDFTQNGSYEKQGNFKGIGDQMVLEEDIWYCCTCEFTGKGEFRQKIKVLGSIEKIEMLFNGQICNESGCENLRDIALTAPSLTVSGSVVATIQEPTRTNTTAVVRKASNDENPLEDTGSAVTAQIAQNYKDLDYQKKEKIEIKTFNGQVSEESSEDMWGLFILAFLSGLTALLTPCVFPMIPMTVSFFIRNKNRTIALRDTAIFSLSIIALYTIVGTIVAFAFGANAANWLSTHWIPNIFFTVIFVIFAASFFGAFEITLPSWLVNKMDAKADKGGITGAIFMAITIALVSFSCTGPIVGTVLVEAVHGGAM
ncbi:MAG: cytochrome c biogenesis protein CcdA, partial [Bacteroidota bacterium]|nr:cytochrome c biogenesis protein CcdA [Bacteroidota bacterium]